MKTGEEQEDLRVRRTHKLLWEALIAELFLHSFEEITVKDICERAMVHRTTFYKHYQDKYALLKQGMRQMYDTLEAEMHALSSTSSGNEPFPALTHLFVHVAQYQQFYTLMLCGDGIGRFQKLVKEYIVEHNEIKMSALAQANLPQPVPPAMYAHFFAGAFLSILAWWLENGMPFSPEQMAHYFLSLHQLPTSH